MVYGWFWLKISQRGIHHVRNSRGIAWKIRRELLGSVRYKSGEVDNNVQSDKTK